MDSYLKYKLDNINNYIKKEITDITEIRTSFIKCYCSIIIDAYVLSSQKDFSNKRNINAFLINRCVDTIHHIYFYLFRYTQNIEMTYYNCHKAIYLYLEFIEQIMKEEDNYIKLTSNDAVTYVYKKTIYEVIASTTLTDSNIINELFESICLYTMIIKKCINIDLLNADKMKNNSHDKLTIVVLKDLFVDILSKSKKSNECVKDLISNINYCDLEKNTSIQFVDFLISSLKTMS